MLSYFKVYKKFAIFFLVFSAIVLFLIYNALTPKTRLPIFAPGKNVNPELVDSTVVHVKKNHFIADFKLTNQNGKTITQNDYKDKIYIADFFFTTCGTICPIMTNHMKKIQDAIIDDDEVLLLSHTVTPEIDSVPQLKKYALKKGVIDSKWNLVTGSKVDIYNLARKSYLVAKYDPTQPDGYGMVHTENFVLVDKKRRIRGMYDGTSDKDIERLLSDLAILKKEYHNKD